MIRNVLYAALIFISSRSLPGFAAQTEVFSMTLLEAEQQALQASNRLKYTASEAEAAHAKAESQFAALLPRLTLEGDFQYAGVVPSIAIGGARAIPLGSNANYSIGPVLRYTLWDTGVARKAYEGLSKLAAARQEEHKNAKVQLLFSVRVAYVQVQLALEELRLINGSLSLARAQEKDIRHRFEAGAANQLDLVTSHRQVIRYELQFSRGQSDLSSRLKDILTLVGNPISVDISKPGPLMSVSGAESISLLLKLEPLQKLIEKQSQGEVSSPNALQPQVRSQGYLAEGSDLLAESQQSALFPVIQASAKSSLNYPNGPVLQQIHQNTIAVNLTFPLFEGNRTRRQADQNLYEADAARYRQAQLLIDLQRDFSKAKQLLQSLREQKELAAQDVLESEESARLYYTSYKAGKNSLLDVQNANHQALQAKVNATQLDAQILSQLIILKALSGSEVLHD